MLNELPYIVENLDPTVAFFRFKKQKSGNFLVTNDVGNFCFLTKEEFQNFLSGKISGNKRQELEEKLFYKTPEYQERMTVLYNQRNSFLAFGPTLHAIILTLRCNHKCEYCHAAVAPMTAKDMDMTMETARKVVDTIFYSSAPSLTIEFQGGEALVNWDVLKFVVEYAYFKSQILQKEVVFLLVTNLTLMTEEKLQWLLDHNVGISTSLDGDQITHNSQRIWKEGDSYQNVTHWIRRITEESIKRWAGEDFRVGALTTWTKTSIKNYKKIIDTYKELGLQTIGFRWLNPYGFALADREKMEFSYEEFMDFYRDGMDYLLELNKSWYFMREMISCVYLQKILSHENAGSFMDIRSPSGVALGTIAYNYDGKVYASDESRMLGRMGINNFLMTPMLETGLQTYQAMAESEITKISAMASTLDGLPGYEESVYKPYLGVDMLYNFTQYGNIYSSYSKDEKNKMQIFMLDYLFEKLQDPENERIFRSWIS